MIRPTYLAALCVSFLLLFGCSSDESDSAVSSASIPGGAGEQGETEVDSAADVPPPVILAPGDTLNQSPVPQMPSHPIVVVETKLGDIRIRLNYEKAPRTVENFLYNYVDRGFYDNTIVHYVDQGFMVAAGGFNTNYELPTTSIPIRNESRNGLRNLRGTIAMSHDAAQPDSATSQFFINLEDNLSLDATDEQEGYTVFGEVVEGMEVLEQIASVPVHDRGEFRKTPVESVLIETIYRADQPQSP